LRARKVWDARTGRELFTLHGYERDVRGVAFSADGKLLASAAENGTVKLHDPGTGREVRTLTGAGSSVAFSPDGAWLAVGGGDRYRGGRVTVHDVASGKAAFTLRGHSRGVSGVSFNRDGKRLASAGHDGAVRVWDTTTRAEIIALSHPGFVTNVVFGPGDRFLASAGGRNMVRGEVRVWDATPWPEKTAASLGP